MQQCLILLITLLFLTAAQANPPFLTDNPEPTEYQHLEFYYYAFLDKTHNTTNVQIPAIEIDWGFAPNWEWYIQAPAVLNALQTGPNTYGLGDTETGILYRFVQETANRPQIGITPAWVIPTGDAQRNLGNGRGWARLPIWLQKSWGSWTSYGGGGYAINSAVGAKNYSFGGLVIQRQLNEKWTLGGDLFTQGADTIDTRSYAIFTAGAYYNLNKNVSLLFSIAHSVVGEEHFQGYVGIYWDLSFSNKK